METQLPTKGALSTNFQAMSIMAKRSPISTTAEHLFLVCRNLTLLTFPCVVLMSFYNEDDNESKRPRCFLWLHHILVSFQTVQRGLHRPTIEHHSRPRTHALGNNHSVDTAALYTYMGRQLVS